MLLYDFESKERLVDEVLAEIRRREAELLAELQAAPGTTSAARRRTGRPPRRRSACGTASTKVGRTSMITASRFGARITGAGGRPSGPGLNTIFPEPQLARSNEMHNRARTRTA